MWGKGALRARLRRGQSGWGQGEPFSAGPSTAGSEMSPQGSQVSAGDEALSIRTCMELTKACEKLVATAAAQGRREAGAHEEVQRFCLVAPAFWEAKVSGNCGLGSHLPEPTV